MPSSCSIRSQLARATHAAANSPNRNVAVASTASSGAVAPAVAAAARRHGRPSLRLLLPPPASPIRRSASTGFAAALELRRNFMHTPAGAQAATAAGLVSFDQFNSAVAALRATSPDRAAPTAPAPLRPVTAPTAAHAASAAVVPTEGSAIYDSVVGVFSPQPPVDARGTKRARAQSPAAPARAGGGGGAGGGAGGGGARALGRAALALMWPRV